MLARASDPPDGEHLAPRSHRLGGVMTVISDEGSWIVPAGRAVFLSAGARTPEHGYDSPSAYAAMVGRARGVAPTVHLGRKCG